MTQANITIEDIPVSTPDVAAKLVKFQGQLDESNVDEKAKIIYDLLEKNPQNLYLLFDFEELEYMNSKSIGYLTDWYGKVTEGGGKIAIAKTRSNILDILQVVGLTQLINCYATLDEAKLALLQQPAGGEAPAAEGGEAQPSGEQQQAPAQEAAPQPQPKPQPKPETQPAQKEEVAPQPQPQAQPEQPAQAPEKKPATPPAQETPAPQQQPPAQPAEEPQKPTDEAAG